MAEQELTMGTKWIDTGGVLLVLHPREDSLPQNGVINLYPSGRVVLDDWDELDEKSKAFWKAVELLKG